MQASTESDQINAVLLNSRPCCRRASFFVQSLELILLSLPVTSIFILRGIRASSFLLYVKQALNYFFPFPFCRTWKCKTFRAHCVSTRCPHHERQKEPIADNRVDQNCFFAIVAYWSRNRVEVLSTSYNCRTNKVIQQIHCYYSTVQKLAQKGLILSRDS